MRRLLILCTVAVLQISAGAFAAQPPTATTAAATITTYHACLPDGTMSFTLNGSVNPGAQPATWYFEYGPTTAYGTQTATQDAGSGSADVPVSATIPGQFGTLHFRVVAVGPDGPVDGADQTIAAFAPPCAPLPGPQLELLPAGTPVASGPQCQFVARVVATAPVTFSVALNARVTPAPYAPQSSGSASFSYGPTTAYGQTTAATAVTWSSSTATPQAISATVAGLPYGITHYQLVVTGPAGATATSGDATVAIPAPPCVEIPPRPATVRWSLVAFSGHHHWARVRFVPPCGATRDPIRVLIARAGHGVRVTLRVVAAPGRICAQAPRARTITVRLPRHTTPGELRHGA